MCGHGYVFPCDGPEVTAERKRSREAQIELGAVASQLLWRRDLPEWEGLRVCALRFALHVGWAAWVQRCMDHPRDPYNGAASYGWGEE